MPAPVCQLYCTTELFKVLQRKIKSGVFIFWFFLMHYLCEKYYKNSLGAQTVKNLPAVQQTWVQSLGQDDPLEKEKATHFSILTWEIP